MRPTVLLSNFSYHFASTVTLPFLDKLLLIVDEALAEYYRFLRQIPKLRPLQRATLYEDRGSSLIVKTVLIGVSTVVRLKSYQG